jgi:hypothetical protein
MTLQTAARETRDRPGISPSASEGAPVPRYRALVGGLILALATLAALAAGGWGLVSSLAGEEPPARIGEAAAVPGGALVIEKVTPEHIAPMKMGKFGQQGMNMAMPNMDMPPDGYTRFAVNVTLEARGGELAYAPEDFRLSGEGFKTDGPVRSQLGEGAVPDGSAVSGNLVFQAPEKAEGLTLEFAGGRAVALDLPADEGQGHGH